MTARVAAAAVRRSRRRLRRIVADLRRSRGVRAYLAREQRPKLHLGAGSARLEGWLNTDVEPYRGVVPLDARRPFPLPDESFDVVFSEHMIEHLDYAYGASMLRESFRVLRPGGRIRVATPDLRRLVEILDDDSEIARRYVDAVLEQLVQDAPARLPVFAVNNILFAHAHRFLYDEPSLTLSLAQAGFVDIRRFDSGESGHELLRGVESHGGGDLNVFDTLVLEALRP